MTKHIRQMDYNVIYNLDTQQQMVQAMGQMVGHFIRILSTAIVQKQINFQMMDQSVQTVIQQMVQSINSNQMG